MTQYNFADLELLEKTNASSMHLKPSDILPEALHRTVGWDMRHHFMVRPDAGD
jgi:hypothetical protein